MRLLFTFAVLAGLCGCDRLEQRPRDVRDHDDAAASAETLVLGDSLSTGAVTHPDFQIDYASIVTRALRGERHVAKASLIDDQASADEVLKAPVRLGVPKNEVEMFGKANAEAAASALLKAIEWPELSWESQLARQRGMDVQRVIIAARNGARSSQARDQVQSWLDAEPHKPAVLPEQVFIFFSGNDLCRNAESALDMTPPEQYAAGIRDAVHALARDTDPNASGTTLYLVSHLDILQLVRNPQLMASKRVHIRDANSAREVSCSEFLKEHQRTDDAAPLAGELARFSYHPMNLCQNVLSHATGLDPTQAKVPMEKLEERMVAYRSVLHKLAEELAADQRLAAAKIRVHHIQATEDVKLVPDDLANDCFHLSAKGQSKLAHAIGGSL